MPTSVLLSLHHLTYGWGRIASQNSLSAYNVDFVLPAFSQKCRKWSISCYCLLFLFQYEYKCEYDILIIRYKFRYDEYKSRLGKHIWSLTCSQVQRQTFYIFLCDCPCTCKTWYYPRCNINITNVSIVLPCVPWPHAYKPPTQDHQKNVIIMIQE